MKKYQGDPVVREVGSGKWEMGRRDPISTSNLPTAYRRYQLKNKNMYQTPTAIRWISGESEALNSGA